MRIFSVLLLVGLCPFSVIEAQQRASSTLPDVVDKVRGSVAEIDLVFNPPIEHPTLSDNPDLEIRQLANCFQPPMKFKCIAGTGFFANKEGVAITAYHVAEDADKAIQKLASIGITARMEVAVPLPNSERIHHNLVAFGVVRLDQDALHDVALLSVGPLGVKSLNARYVKLDLKRPRDGSGVFTCGFPLSAESLTTSEGTIATAWGMENLLTAHAHGIQDMINIYRVNLTINPGSSGAPVFSRETGDLVGMAVESRGAPGGYVGIVVPARYISEVLQKNHVSFDAGSESSQK